MGSRLSLAGGLLSLKILSVEMHATTRRRRLLTAHERLDPAAFANLWNSMTDAGDPGLEILHTYTVKENLRQLLALSGTNPERATIRAPLWRQHEQAAASPSPGVHRFVATIEAWWPAIEAATPSATATSTTTAATYAGPALVNTDEPQPRSAKFPVTFDEPSRLSSKP